MSSFVETKALEQLTKSPVEFVEYPSLSTAFCFLLSGKHLLLCSSGFCSDGNDLKQIEANFTLLLCFFISFYSVLRFHSMFTPTVTSPAATTQFRSQMHL